MADVKGIGGVFIDSNDAAELARWYEEKLGIEMEAHPNGIGYYRVFETRDVETSIVRENPVFAINHAQDKVAESGRGFVINLRIDNLAEFLEQLRTKGVEIEDRILEWERGKHAWIRDQDGNRVELYEEILVAGVD
jgi:catechol 2,3-dioxygenase-like lactoylglutathione lyase family enzyme